MPLNWYVTELEKLVAIYTKFDKKNTYLNKPFNFT
jgi:hypothetical protein